MKKFILCFIIILLSVITQAQTRKPYTQGSVWQVSFIQTKANMGELYLKSLNELWIKVMKQAKAEGIIQDYKIFRGQAATKDDWDIMLMYEVKNYASLDGMSDKMEAIRNKIIPGEDAQLKAATSRNDMRQAFGAKLTRELIFQ